MKSLRGFGPTRKKVKEYDHTSAKDSKDRKQQSRQSLHQRETCGEESVYHALVLFFSIYFY